MFERTPHPCTQPKRMTRMTRKCALADASSSRPGAEFVVYFVNSPALVPRAIAWSRATDHSRIRRSPAPARLLKMPPVQGAALRVRSPEALSQPAGGGDPGYARG